MIVLKMKYIILIFSLLLFFSCNNNSKSFNNKDVAHEHKESKIVTIPEYSIKIINVFPHDSLAYTQGLLYYNGFLYESTGLRRHSSLRKVDIKSANLTLLPRTFYINYLCFRTSAEYDSFIVG